jgi:GNAT superfamily N-acetyltransferase
LTIRQLTAADLEACAEVLEIADDDLTVRRGLTPGPRNREALLKLFAHIERNFPDRGWVAERDGRIQAFGSAVRYDDLTFLSFLFVLPDAQAAGLGRELLERAMHDSDYRGVCIASYQPISTALYAKYGMVPRVPIYMLLGKPYGDLPELPTNVELRPVGADEVAELDRELCGFARTNDHEFWGGLGRKRFGLYEDESLDGYGYMQESGRLGPFIVRRREYLLPFVGALVAMSPDTEAWMVNVPGPASEVYVGLLHAGMRLEGPPAIYCATDLRIDHSRYLPGGYALP